MSQTYTKILFFVLLITVLISCDATKYVPEGKDLLHSNKILVNENKAEKELYNYIVQRPNSSIFSVPFSLYFYNMGNLDFPKTFDEWIEQNEKKYNRYESIFSKKQTFVVYKLKKSFNNWFLTKGQAPEIYDKSKTDKTAASFRNYFFSNGFFEAEVSYDELQSEDKKMDIVYKVKTNDQYYIDTIESKISSPVLDSIYQANIKDTYLKPRKPFVFSDFELEQKRLTTLFRNAGVFYFAANRIGYWTDSIHETKFKKVVLKIPDRLVKKEDSTYLEPFRIHRIRNVKIYTDFDIAHRDLQQKDSATFEGITYYAPEKLEYNPKYLSDAIFIKPGSVYSDIDKSNTLNHIRKLNNFRTSIDIKYIDNNDDTLDVIIYLTQVKRYAFTVNLDATTSNVKPFGILGKFSYVDKNLFKGAEVFDISFQGSFLNVSKDASNASGFFNAWEVILKSSLVFPRIFFPLNTDKIIPKYMSPQTVIDLSSGIQKNIGLDRQTFTTGLGYAWQSSKAVGHKLDLYNLQYIENKNIENYFFIYNSEYEKMNLVSQNIDHQPLDKDNDVILDFIDKVLDPGNNYEHSHPKDYDVTTDVNERYNILIEDVLVPVISYGVTFNTKDHINDQNFYFITGRIVSSGSLTTLLANKTNDRGQKTMFGLPIAQYIKGEIEFKKYFDLHEDNIFVFRTFIGAAIPFGNSSSIPFSRSYSAGGSNDIRAWRTYDLGPGAEVNALEFNVGSLKMVTNFEYRFKVMDKIYSALFVDVGNIWDITNSNLVSDAGKFTSLKSLKNSAIGSGFGIRYNFGFLVFRFDIGFKTYEPYLLKENKWFNNYNFGNAVYNIGINYPF